MGSFRLRRLASFRCGQLTFNGSRGIDLSQRRSRNPLGSFRPAGPMALGTFRQVCGGQTLERHEKFAYHAIRKGLGICWVRFGFAGGNPFGRKWLCFVRDRVGRDRCRAAMVGGSIDRNVGSEYTGRGSAGPGGEAFASWHAGDRSTTPRTWGSRPRLRLARSDVRCLYPRDAHGL